jgi:AcrR family transcriptional regulator
VAKQERAERTRAAILDAAATVFDTQGFLGASLSDILAEAGVTKGALYFHFSSKEELAHAIMDEQFSVWRPPVEIEKPGVQAAIDLTHNMARNLLRNVRVRASIRLVIEQGTYTDPSPGPYQQWIGVVHDCLESGQAQGDLRKELDLGDLATFVVSSFTGVQISSQVLTNRDDISERVTNMWQFVLPGIVQPRRLAKFDPAGSPED